jgi:hypothetical protein
LRIAARGGGAHYPGRQRCTPSRRFLAIRFVSQRRPEAGYADLAPAVVNVGFERWTCERHLYQLRHGNHLPNPLLLINKQIPDRNDNLHQGLNARSLVQSGVTVQIPLPRHHDGLRCAQLILRENQNCTSPAIRHIMLFIGVKGEFLTQRRPQTLGDLPWESTPHDFKRSPRQCWSLPAPMHERPPRSRGSCSGPDSVGLTEQGVERLLILCKRVEKKLIRSRARLALPIAHVSVTPVSGN